MSLAKRLASQFEIYAPVFYGKTGQTVNGLRAVLCMRREFEIWRLRQKSPIVDWIRDLVSRIEQDKQPSSGVGIVGMCMSGGIVLASITHPAVTAGVVAQPGLPLALTCLASKARRSDLGMNAEQIGEAKASATPVLTLRYGKDCICPQERIPSLLEQIPNATAPPSYLDGVRSHATLTDHYRDDATASIQKLSERAIEDTIQFLAGHLACSRPTRLDRRLNDRRPQRSAASEIEP